MIPKTHYKELLDISREKLREGLENKSYRLSAIESALKDLLSQHAEKHCLVSQKEKLFRQIEKVIEETLKYYPHFTSRALPDVYREVIKGERLTWFMAWGFIPQKDSALIDSALLAMHKGFNLQWDEAKFIPVMHLHLKHELGRNSIKKQMEAHMQKVLAIDNMTEMNRYYLLQAPATPTRLHYLYLKNVLNKFYGFQKKPDINLAELEKNYGASIRYVLINDPRGLERLSRLCPGDTIYQCYIKRVLLGDTLQHVLINHTDIRKKNKI